MVEAHFTFWENLRCGHIIFQSILPKSFIIIIFLIGKLQHTPNLLIILHENIQLQEHCLIVYGIDKEMETTIPKPSLNLSPSFENTNEVFFWHWRSCLCNGKYKKKKNCLWVRFHYTWIFLSSQNLNQLFYFIKQMAQWNLFCSLTNVAKI